MLGIRDKNSANKIFFFFNYYIFLFFDSLTNLALVFRCF